MPPLPDAFYLTLRWIVTCLMISVVRDVWRARRVNGPVTDALAETFVVFLGLILWNSVYLTCLYLGYWNEFSRFLGRHAPLLWVPLTLVLLRFHWARRVRREE